MAITNIVGVKNHCAFPIYVYNAENPGDTQNRPMPGVEIHPGDTYGHNMWIPWCTNAADFAKHRIQIATAFNPNFCIWQENSSDGDHVRYCTDNTFHCTGNLIPGNSNVGGNRILYIEGTLASGADLRIHLESL
ncbi:hypothetical protein KDH_27270 [Dictyobacter sp. S3.2.2.5]|uniref:Uncharacterized protein n=1 Tax=Dictyobacter halimunensis TaxID=3026934 RepID=A0ABQ6FQM3_9CHLR|nr:hypothetical protein KDH_27270 [Dictyobacter sp. S3.2.2.5]